MKITTGQTLLIAGGLFLAYRAYQSFNGDWFNPTSDKNLINQGAEGLYSGVTGSDGTPGTDLAWLVHETEKVDPTSDKNIANQGAVGAYQWLTGSDGTPGTDLAAWLNPGPNGG